MTDVQRRDDDVAGTTPPPAPGPETSTAPAVRAREPDAEPRTEPDAEPMTEPDREATVLEQDLPPVPADEQDGLPETTPDVAAATAPSPPAPAPPPVGHSWRTIGRALAPRATRAQVTAALLCALLGFALAVQLQQNREEGLATLRQDELVRILDEVTQRQEELEDEAATLRQQRAELASGSDSERAAREAAAERAEVQGILAGRLPATGPGVEILIGQPEGPIPALVLHNVLEELRNAGAEAVQLDDLRLTASSYFVDTSEGVVVDGTLLEPPYQWLAIGDPDTIVPALNMPGGAMAEVRRSSGTTAVEQRPVVEVSATRTVPAPEFATPLPAPADG